jgi:coenzyme F420-0:L-glutamate ligase / coenzyme F420-1:gamma-L-glutamate ligase
MGITETYHSFLRSRRSVRRFLAQEVPKELLERILETATWAPSSHNRQPWRFVVLATGQSRLRLAQEMGDAFRRDLLADGLSEQEVERQVLRSQQRILEAPAAILLCLDPTDLDVYPDAVRQQFELTMGTQSVALSGGTLLLAAHAEGMGGVWVCAPLFAPDVVCKALGLPQTWIPQGMLLLGYPERNPEPRPRKPVKEVAIFL